MMKMNEYVRNATTKSHGSVKLAGGLYGFAKSVFLILFDGALINARSRVKKNFFLTCNLFVLKKM